MPGTTRDLNRPAPSSPLATDEGQFFIQAWQSCNDVLSVFEYFFSNNCQCTSTSSTGEDIINVNLSLVSINSLTDSPHQHFWQPLWLGTSNISCFFWSLRWRANITNITESPGIKFSSYLTCVKEISYNNQFLQKQTTLEQLLIGITTIFVFLTVLPSMSNGV